MVLQIRSVHPLLLPLLSQLLLGPGGLDFAQRGWSSWLRLWKGFSGGCATHLALATHSMVTSEVPATTLVFLGGMMMVGAMGSAGPPTSEKTGSVVGG